MNLNELRDKAYKTACDHGFHDEELSNEHWFCLVISELMEAVEADRKEKYAKISKFNMDYKRYPALVDEIKRFSCSFEKNIKDSVEDELADAVIRLLDLAGLRGVSVELTENFNGCIEDTETFTESIYGISSLPTAYRKVFDFDTTINDMVHLTFGLANHLDIDLMWHVNQKMKYNQSREWLHGKKY